MPRGMEISVLESSIIVVLVLVFLGFGSYIFLMIYYPEWVGITGDSAHKTMSEHREGSQADDSDFFAENGSEDKRK